MIGNRAAGREFNVAESSIREWRKNEQRLRCDVEVFDDNYLQSSRGVCTCSFAHSLSALLKLHENLLVNCGAINEIAKTGKRSEEGVSKEALGFPYADFI